MVYSLIISFNNCFILSCKKFNFRRWQLGWVIEGWHFFSLDYWSEFLMPGVELQNFLTECLNRTGHTPIS